MMFFFESTDRLAVSDGSSSLTYRKLNSQADAIAAGLLNSGVSADVLVGLCMRRNVHTIAALLGILRAGGAYLPIEVDQPRRRLKYIIDEAKPRFLLVQDETYASKVAGLAPFVTLQEAASASPFF